MIPFTYIGIMPTNKALLTPARDLDTAETRTLLERWAKLHAVRTVLALPRHSNMCISRLDPDHTCSDATGGASCRCSAHPIELCQLCVIPSLTGCGVASLLMSEALGQARLRQNDVDAHRDSSCRAGSRRPMFAIAGD